jgi:hypothetical protein
VERKAWFYRGLNFLNTFVVFFLIIFSSLLATEPTSESLSAKEFLNLELEKTLPLIEKLSKEETKELITSLRIEARTSYPKIDHFYFLISHLEEMTAIEKEQARLKSLLWVFGLALVLFMGFLAFLLLRQRKAINDINQLTES